MIMKIRIVKVIVMAVVVLLLSACRGGKDVVGPGDGKIDIVSGDARAAAVSVIEAYKPWSTLQSGGSVTIGGGGKDFTSSMQLRMLKDSLIVISLRPLLGIEMGKMLLARDSVLIIDKWHKQYLLEPVKLITSGIDVTIGNVQDIFLGRPFTVGGGSLSADDRWEAVVGNELVITPGEQDGNKFTYSFAYGADGKVVALTVEPRHESVGSYSVTYGDVDDTPRGPAPHSISANATIRNAPLKLELDLNNIQWDKNVKQEEFVAPKGYKRMNIRSLMSLFGE